jgi:hypothetical protein
MTEQVDLLPCPFCVTEFPPVTTTDKCGATVICTGCSALGPTRGAEAEAITAWNTRAAATEIEALRAQVAGLLVPTWYWDINDGEMSCDTPGDVIDQDAELGNVYEISCGARLPNIWVATMPKGDPDDGEWDLQEFATEAEARAALGDAK